MSTKNECISVAEEEDRYFTQKAYFKACKPFSSPYPTLYKYLTLQLTYDGKKQLYISVLREKDPK